MFMSIHEIYISNNCLFFSPHTQLIQSLTGTVQCTDMRELRSYIHLISALSRHEHQWSRESKSSHITHVMVSTISYSTTTYYYSYLLLLLLLFITTATYYYCYLLLLLLITTATYYS